MSNMRKTRRNIEEFGSIKTPLGTVRRLGDDDWFEVLMKKIIMKKSRQKSNLKFKLD